MLERTTARSFGLVALVFSGAWGLGCQPSSDEGDAGALACVSDRQCSSANLVCDVASGTCVQCVSAADCASSEACRQHACVAIVACSSSRMCPAQVCDTTRGFCVDCVTDVDCTTGETCSDGYCAAPPTSCVSDRECSAMGLVCDRADGHCVECNASSDCPGSVVCVAHSCGPMPGGDAGGAPDAASAPDVGVDAAAIVDAASSVDSEFVRADAAGGATSAGVHFTWTISDTSGSLSCADVGMAQVLVNVTPFSGGSGVSRTFPCRDGVGDVTGLPLGGASVSSQGNDSSGTFLHAGGGGTVMLPSAPCDSIVSGSCMRNFAIAFHY